MRRGAAAEGEDVAAAAPKVDCVRSGNMGAACTCSIQCMPPLSRIAICNPCCSLDISRCCYNLDKCCPAKLSGIQAPDSFEPAAGEVTEAMDGYFKYTELARVAAGPTPHAGGTLRRW